METKGRGVLTDVKRSEICAILAVGCSRTTAARYVGCHPDTIRNTAKREPEFAEALAQAETKHEIQHLAHINAAAKEGRYWRAAAWALERTHPDRYGRRRPYSVSPEQLSQALAQFASIILEEVTDEELQERIFERLSELTEKLQSLSTGDGR
jgi:hypothetical protein